MQSSLDVKLTPFTKTEKLTTAQYYTSNDNFDNKLSTVNQ